MIRERLLLDAYLKERQKQNLLAQTLFKAAKMLSGQSMNDVMEVVDRSQKYIDLMFPWNTSTPNDSQVIQWMKQHEPGKQGDTDG